MKDHGKGKINLGKNFLVIMLVGFAIFNMICIEVIPAYHSNQELVHEINNKNPLKDFKQFKIPKTSKWENIEIELSIDYTIHAINRDGKLYWRLLVTNGGLECGLHGEEQPFFKYLLETSGEIESITVEFGDPVSISATPTPYLVPQVLGSNGEVLADAWQGSINVDNLADWTLNHLSKNTVAYNNGELYSLKIYPVEFLASGSARIFRNVKVSYSTPQNQMWSSPSAPDPSHKPTGPVKYLIITHPNLVNAVEPFAKWKSQKGLFTQVVTTEELDDMYSEGDLQLKMRKYVQKMESKYDLDYLLLVGDWDLVPTRNTKNSYAQPMMGEPDTFASDLYYACVDQGTTWNKDDDYEYAEESEVDDSIPDMAIGRIAINSPSVLSSVLKGLMDREKNPSWDTSTGESIYMAGDPGYMTGEPTEVMDHFWTKYGDDVFTGRETIYYDDSGTLTFSSSSFKKVAEAKHQAMCYFGHGKPTGFPDLYSNSQVPQLNTTGTDGSIFAMACLVGWFDDPSQGTGMGAVENCFAEQLTETPGKGVVGFIGSSRMAVGNIDTTYSDDAPGLEEDYWRAIREAAKGNITTTVGSVWRETITNFASSFYPFRSQGFDNSGLRTFLEYNLLGEPDAPLIFRQPEELQLEYQLSSDKSSIIAKVTNATGAPMPGATVAIYRAYELGRAGSTNSNGAVTIDIPPNNGGVIEITTSRPGDVPVNYTFSLPDNLAPLPEYKINPEEPDGDNDFYISNPVVELSGDEPVDVQYRIDDGSVVNSESSATVVVPDGKHTIHFRVKDAEGQWSEWFQLNISVDMTPPVLTIITEPASPDGENGWFISEPTIILNSNEPLNSSLFRVDNEDETEYNSPVQVAEGVHEYSFLAYDLAGNENTTGLSIKVDLSAPVSVANVSHPPDGENGYYITPPTIVLKNPDESGVRLEYRWDSGAWKKYYSPFTPAVGVHTLYYRGVDSAGNSELEHNIIFQLDSKAPSLDLVVTPSIPDGKNGFYCSNPVIDITTDSGEVFYCLVDTTKEVSWSDSDEPLTGSVVIPDGKWILYVKAVDDAGNVGYLDPVTFKVDTLPPAISWAVKPSEADGDSGWYSSSPAIELTTDSEDVKMYWAYSDSESWTEYNHDITLISGVHTLRFKAVDLAGNTYITESTQLKVDLESPHLMIEKPETDALVGTSVLVSWHGADELSGIYQYKLRLDSKSWHELGNDTMFEFDNLKSGEHTVHVTAYDSAGNSITVKRTFSVDATTPTIVTRIPRGKNILVDSRLVITFSEAMNEDSLIVDVDGISGTLSWEGKTVIFTPEQNLEYSMKYNVKVTGSDKYNNELNYDSWYFYTESAPASEESASMPMLVFVGLGLAIGITASIMVSIVAVILYQKKQKRVQQK